MVVARLRNAARRHVGVADRLDLLEAVARREVVEEREQLSEPRAILAHDGMLRVFAIGKDEATYMVAQGSGGFGAWTSLGGKATSNPTVANNADGRLEVFVRGTDGALYGASPR